MKGNLVIVESPTKATKIKSYLGNGYTVMASQGHIRDLQDNNLSIDIQDGFRPQYVVPDAKKKIVEELKKLASQADTVLLASDEDREGEAIAWHLYDVLGLVPEKTKRIVFHEITKPAILDAVKNPRDIDMNLVDAQQARRVLDRLVGFELSPILWKKIQPKLSAGRVQSVALRLIVDREREIQSFLNESYYKVDALFSPDGGGSTVKATLDRHFTCPEEVLDFLNRSKGAAYQVCDISSKEGFRTPAAPFTTSTLQQEAVRKLGMSVSQTMQVAQKLYEEGMITYMRTDSVNLSSLAINSAKNLICANFGEEYSRPRQYRTKAKGAQEAHEAIRPTYMDRADIEGTSQERRLYQLIWKRTMASQMADAKVMNTCIQISGDRIEEKYRIETTKVLFDGFLKLYMESSDDETSDNPAEMVLPDMMKGCAVTEHGITAACKFTAAPQRYTQASLVKKLEELGIGRPSTYSSIIGTLVKGRGYIVEGNKEGRKVKVTDYSMENGVTKSSERVETIGAEKGRLLPQDIGIMVSDYLIAHFPEIMDYGFTADVEKDFDKIADGGKEWNKMIAGFYSPFHQNVQTALEDNHYNRIEREIGIDPADGMMIVARFGQYGPFVQKGEGENRVFASLAKGQIIESLTLDEALKLLQLPRNLGKVDGTDVVVTKGRFGAYLKYGDRNISIPKGKDPLKLTLSDAGELISSSQTEQTVKVIAQWGDTQIIDGRYGPYIKSAGSNYRIPKDCNAYNLKEEEVRKIIETSQPTAKKRSYFKKK